MSLQMALFHLFFSDWVIWGVRLPGGSKGKESACSAGDAGDMGPVPGWGRSAGRGNGSPLQYSCLRNPMDRGAWWTTVHKVPKCQAWLSTCVYLSVYLSIYLIWGIHHLDLPFGRDSLSTQPFWEDGTLPLSHNAVSWSRMVRLLSSCRQRLAGYCSARASWGIPALPFSFRRYGDAITPPCSGFLLTPDRDFSFPNQCSRKYHFLASLLFGSKQKSVKVIGIGTSLSKDRDKSPCLHCQRASATGESLSSLNFLQFGLWQKPLAWEKEQKKRNLRGRNGAM